MLTPWPSPIYFAGLSEPGPLERYLVLSVATNCQPGDPSRATIPLIFFLPTPHRLSFTAGWAGISLGMEISFPDGVAWRLHEAWRAKLF
jgi:hypothetical protein